MIYKKQLENNETSNFHKKKIKHCCKFKEVAIRVPSVDSGYMVDLNSGVISLPEHAMTMLPIKMEAPPETCQLTMGGQEEMQEDDHRLWLMEQGLFRVCFKKDWIKCILLMLLLTALQITLYMLVNNASTIVIIIRIILGCALAMLFGWACVNSIFYKNAKRKYNKIFEKKSRGVKT